MCVWALKGPFLPHSLGGLACHVMGDSHKCWGQDWEAVGGGDGTPVPCLWAGYSIKCEYSAHKEGVLKEEMLLACEGGTGACVRVTVQARVMGECEA